MEVKPQQSNHAITTLKNELKQLQKKFSKLEEDITVINTKKEQIEADLAKPENYTDHTKFSQLETEYKKVQQQKAEADKQYEQMFERIMELEGQIG